MKLIVLPSVMDAKTLEHLTHAQVAEWMQHQAVILEEEVSHMRLEVRAAQAQIIAKERLAKEYIIMARKLLHPAQVTIEETTVHVPFHFPPQPPPFSKPQPTEE